MLEPGAINRQFERDVADFDRWPEWMKKLSGQTGGSEFRATDDRMDLQELDPGNAQGTTQP